MTWPMLTTYDRLTPNATTAARAEDFTKSYLGIRFIIGMIGLLLPVSLLVIDSVFIDTPVSARGSMSAYYHSGARDLFVGGLVAVGVTLIGYLWWRWQTWDFWLSVAAGFGAIGVAMFPTGREGVDASDTSCADPVGPSIPACAPIQVRLGEGPVEALHFGFTLLVVVSFAALALVFALRDFGYGAAAHQISAGDRSRLGVAATWRHVRSTGVIAHLRSIPRTILYAVCCLGVINGGIWALVGPDWPWPRGYTGEFIAFSSFGCAWMIASWDLLRQLPLLNRVSD